MRHLKRGRKLNRDREHRDAMFNNMLVSLFRYERIQTTVAKAKELRRISEKLITRARENSLHNKRIVLRRLHDRDVVAKLFDDIAPKYRSVHGGYTRIIRLGRRQGDGAELSLIELVDVENRVGQKEKAKTSAQPKKPVKSKESVAQQKPKAPTPKETGEKPEVKKKEPAKAKSGKTGGTKSKSEKSETTQTKSVKAKTTKAKTTKAKAEPKE